MDKKVFSIFIFSLLFLFFVSSVSAVNIEDNNMTSLSDGSNTNQNIANDISNDEIQSKFDNAKDGDTFVFIDTEYNDISLVVDKKLNILSKNASIVYSSDKLTDKARDLGLDKTFGFYFTSKSAGSVLSGITIVASNSDCGVICGQYKKCFS